MAGKWNKKVAVVGAGLGGIAAALSLATEGFEVELFEKNERIGGKLNLLEKEGYSFDLGPSILILPQYFRSLFERAGKKMEDYVEILELSPQWRSFFEDGTQIDLDGDISKLEKELARFRQEDVRGFFRFLDYSRELYNFSKEIYFDEGADTVWEMLRLKGPLKLIRKTDIPWSVSQGVSRYIKEPHWKTMLDFFIKYVGSSSYDAPAVLNLMLYSQVGFGAWYVQGGMYNLARGFERLLRELGVQIHLGEEVVRLVRHGDEVRSLLLQDGREVLADIFVSNMEVLPAYEKLLEEDRSFLKKLEKFEPACSGLVIHLGVDREYPQLAHHNFFFSGDQKKHFESVFHHKELPHDPTIYLVAPTRTDKTIAPEGHEIIKALPHIPYLQNPPFTPDDYEALKERVLDKLERMGLTDLRQHIVFEDVLTPDDIQRMYYSNKGSIYGVVADRKKNLGLKARKKSNRYRNLYFVGGSVNPGGGMPMVLLSGQQVRDRILKDLS
jgi:diapolycopene oxygenase